MAESTLKTLRRYFTGKTIVLPDKKSGNLKLKSVDPRIVGQSPYWRPKTSSIYGNYMSHRSHQYHRLYLFREYQMMEKDPIIARALDILSEESALKDEYGEMIQIECDNNDITITLEHLFYEVLNVDFNLRGWIRGMLKFGDVFLYLNIRERLGVVDVVPLETSEVQREEDEETGAITFEANQVMAKDIPFERMAHFRNTKDQEFLPYGTSTLESIRKYWKMQTLLEDFMMVYYLLRSVNQRVFRVDVGGLSRPQAEQYVQRVREMFKKEPLQDTDTGEYNLKYDPLTMIDDIVLPVRQGYDNTTFDEIPASTETDLIQGVEYLRQKIMAGLGIPNFLLNYEETINSKCLHPDTGILMLNGGVMTIKEISDAYDESVKNDEEFDLWVYTYNEDKDEYEPSKIRWAEKTRLDAQLVKVTFDDDTYIITTPDHGFMKKGGGKIEAQNLKYDDSVQSIKIRHKQMGGGKRAKYEQVYQPNTKKVHSVEFLEDTSDTYNMEVDSPYHNYVTDCFVTIYNSTASSEDIRFGKTIEKIQNIIVDELEKIAVIHLILQGYEKKEIFSFNISLTPSSDLREMEKLEKLRSRLDIARDAVDTELLSKDWVYKNIFNFGDDEIVEIRSGIINDKISQQMGEKSVEKALEEPEPDEEEPDTSDPSEPASGEGSEGGQLPASTKDDEQENAPKGRIDQLLQSRNTNKGNTREPRAGKNQDSRKDDL